MRNHPDLRRLIPITALRHLYRLLRDFPKEEFQLSVAREFHRRPKQLAKLIVESRRHFKLYDNRTEGFHERSEPLTEALRTNGKLANTLVQQLAALGSRAAKVRVARQCDFQYIDYEINPRRTTASKFENGKSGQSSGTGWVDLLLSNANDQTPIVGEIKADTDVNPFFGLIQCLMYAVELSTESQRTRLKEFYKNRFAAGSSGTEEVIDIYLFLLRYPEDQVSREFLTLTDQLSARLMADNTLGLGFIRRIVALENPMAEPALSAFSVAFSHERAS